MPPPTDQTNRFLFDPQRAAMRPHDYQQTLITNLDNAIVPARPGDRLLVSLATAGGKNLVSNNTVAGLVSTGRRVLRVTLNWELAAQTADDFCGRFPQGARVSGYFGNNGAGAMAGVDHNPDAAVVFTTIQSAMSPSAGALRERRFDFVLVDEVHWGEDKSLYNDLYECYATEAVFIGFTGTPRKWTNYKLVPPAVSLRQLIDQGVLPPPELSTVNTHVEWDPRLTRDGSDVDEPSLAALAVKEKRNQTIVDTYVDGANAYGKTIAFACNIAHAARLTEMMRQAGVRAYLVHSAMPDKDRAQAVSAFRVEHQAVLVNVLTAVHGLDIPDVRTVMLARPTTSDILLEQMVGRAVRRWPGKDRFCVVDFVDNVRSVGDVPLVRPEGFLGTRTGPLGRGPRLLRHEHAMAELVRFPRLVGYEPLAGLLVHPMQTFGIEFELAHPDYHPGRGAWWNNIANELLAALRAVVPTASTPAISHGDAKDNSLWNVVEDGSCGFEVTSRILKGEQGFVEVLDALRVIESVAARCGLVVNRTTGAHVHLAWLDAPSSLHHLIEGAAYYEQALLTLVAPSRADNQYAASVRAQHARIRHFTRKDEWQRHAAHTRYEAVNLTNLFEGYGTVEIRMHHGTLEASKILLWLSLWMTLLRRSLDGSITGGRRFRITNRPLSRTRRGDISRLAENLCATPEMVTALVARRAHILTQSWLRSSQYKDIARRLPASWRRIEPREVLALAAE